MNLFLSWQDWTVSYQYTEHRLCLHVFQIHRTFTWHFNWSRTHNDDNDDEDDNSHNTLKPQRVREQKKRYMITTENKRNKNTKVSFGTSAQHTHGLKCCDLVLHQRLVEGIKDYWERPFQSEHIKSFEMESSWGWETKPFQKIQVFSASREI